MARGAWLIWLVSSLAFTACATGDPVSPTQCGGVACEGGQATTSYFGYRRPLPLDIVIVLDDNISAGPYADRLDKALREMMDETLPVTHWGRDNRDINVAIVPAAMGPRRAGRAAPLWPAAPSCSWPAGSFLHSTRLCSAPSNFQGSIVDAVACAALQMPASGRAPRPLETIRAVLGPGGPAETSGFRRKDAPLLLAVVSNGDEPASDATDAVGATRDLLSTVAEEYDVLVGVVAPAIATGLARFARSFGEVGAFTDIDARSWPALRFLTRSALFAEWWPDCVDWPLADANPDVDGIQPDCVGTEVHQSSAGRTEDILPPCPADGSAPGPCWKTVRDAVLCGPDMLQFLVDRPPPACLPDYNIKYTLTCATQLE